MRQAITWTNADPVHRRIYGALGGGELIWGMYFVKFQNIFLSAILQSFFIM